MIQVEGIFAGGGGSKYKPYLTFISPYAFTVSVSTPGWDGTMEYSTDATTWTAWDGSAITSAIGVNDDAGYYVVYLRGTGNTVFVGDTVEGATGFTLDGMSIQCKGNIEMLLDYATAEAGGHPSMGIKCFYNLFENCTALVAPPELPAIEVSESSYTRMFFGCSHLVAAPKLPAETVAASGYAYMFAYCTSLVYLPVINATSAESFACMVMFGECSKIKLSTEADAEYTQPYKLSIDQNQNMFYNTGGTFTGEPTSNTTYYVSNTNIVV